MDTERHQEHGWNRFADDGFQDGVERAGAGWNSVLLPQICPKRNARNEEALENINEFKGFNVLLFGGKIGI
ncbi:MAG TPA: hypothetical protein VL178_00855 [Pseudomonas sp.]|nr:hypothetical protein [Pseudomonas sp.]